MLRLLAEVAVKINLQPSYYEVISASTRSAARYSSTIAVIKILSSLENFPIIIAGYSLQTV